MCALAAVHPSVPFSAALRAARRTRVDFVAERKTPSYTLRKVSHAQGHRGHDHKPDGAAARQDLLKWWDAGHRAMPWRRETPADDKKAWAYGVWVSEVMLQQTQVSRVDPYWRRWMERWPSVESLAQADESDVKALWSGLGYYRRCAFFARRCEAVSISKRVAHLKRPVAQGQGRRAVYGRSDLVDRVWRTDARRGWERRARVLEISYVWREADGQVWWSLAGSLTDGCDRPGAVNQALMELGATTCSKQKPSCGGCPLRGHCAAFKAQVVDKYPVVIKKAPPVKVAVCLVVLRHNDRVALVAPRDRSQSPFRLEGLWELPGTRIEGEPDENAIVQGLDDALRALGPIIKDSARRSRSRTRSLPPDTPSTSNAATSTTRPSRTSSGSPWTELGTKGCSSVVKKAVDAAAKIDAKRKLQGPADAQLQAGEEGHARVACAAAASARRHSGELAPRLRRSSSSARFYSRLSPPWIVVLSRFAPPHRSGRPPQATLDHHDCRRRDGSIHRCGCEFCAPVPTASSSPLRTRLWHRPVAPGRASKQNAFICRHVHAPWINCYSFKPPEGYDSDADDPDDKDNPVMSLSDSMARGARGPPTASS